MIAAMLILVISGWSRRSVRRVIVLMGQISAVERQGSMGTIEVWLQPALKGQPESDQQNQHKESTERHKFR